MYLKSIELAGFKSFTDRTIIKLEDGISCIVGPNGSGKSNIADAVRWVLGEQSARILRGHKMEDVIFAGSDKRKPLGMAEVILHIDNSDGSLPVEFSEVDVCRRAYRDGDSEYLLNGRQCRLSDIREMFMDSGISNNSLALIGQGRIQEVVNMKPEERRLLLEDAAGIVKYRTRKQTAQRKLADTEQNLTRIWDIISELSARLAPLAEQSSRAETFLQLKTSADQQEINLLLQEMLENRQLLRQNSQALQEKRDKAAVVETGRLEAEAALAEARLNYDRAEEQIAMARQQLFDLKTGREQAEAQAALWQEKAAAAEANISRLQAELSSLLQQDSGFVAEVERLQQRQTAAGQELQAAEAEIGEREAAFAAKREAVADLQAEQEIAQQDILANTEQLANLNNELTFLQKTLAEAEQGLTAADQNMAALRQEEQSGAAKAEVMQQELAALQQRREANKTALQELAGRLNRQEAELVQANEANVSVRMQLNSEESRLKILSEMAENKSGFYPGVRSILRAKEQGKLPTDGVLGVLLDLIESDVRYSQALEAAVGAGLQNLVVRDDQAARACVAYLKQEKLGRATFLPLASLRWRPNGEIEQALGRPGVIGRCSQVINCAEPVRPAVEFLFANTLLVENLDVATQVARQHRQQFKIVTLAGDIISPGGSITGGSRQKNSGDLLQKKNQLAQLQHSVQKLRQQGEAGRQRLVELEQQRADLDAERAELAAADRELELQYLGKVKDITHLRDNLADKQEQLAQMERDQAAAQQEQARLQRRRQELAADLADWDAGSQRANEQLEQLRQRWQVENEELEAQRQALEQSRLQALEKRQAYQSLDNEVQRLTAEKGSLFEQKEQKEQAAAQYQQQLAEQRQAWQDKLAEAQSLAGQIAEAEEQLAQATDENGLLKQQIEAGERQTAALSRDGGVLQQEIHQLEVKEARLQTEDAAGVQKLAEGFELTFEQALPQLDESMSRPQLVQNLKLLKKQLAALGNVNLDAIEEYRQVRERYEFLSAQREDLLEAHNSLLNVIKEMEEIMTQRFRATFEQVNLNFGQTFVQLFGGGSAALFLTEPDDLLTSGVDLLVQPPGKKLINYNLLSGGEKSLIGVALVLAIFQVKPSPFCILDEVDAALDEANVDRFAEYIKMFKLKTQFIVVTHRQGTMEAADRLWGVTMEKDGVSKMVSVRLTDDLQQYVS